MPNVPLAIVISQNGREIRQRQPFTNVLRRFNTGKSVFLSLPLDLTAWTDDSSASQRLGNASSGAYKALLTRPACPLTQPTPAEQDSPIIMAILARRSSWTESYLGVDVPQNFQ